MQIKRPKILQRTKNSYTFQCQGAIFKESIVYGFEHRSWYYWNKMLKY